MKEITIVGCGNIGSRHLQAVSKIEDALEIHIVEPNDISKKIAQERLEQNTSNHEYIWHNDIKEMNQKSDITIIATSAINRVQIIKELLKLDHKKFLIEKIVCQSIEEYKELIKELKKFNSIGWVNTPRRYFSSYKIIQNMISKNEPIEMKITGTNFGLGTNAIHFIDLFAWFVKDFKIKLDGSLLDDEILENKRGANYLEFLGIIQGISNKSHLKIESTKKDGVPVKIEIKNAKHQLIIDENKQEIQDLLNPDKKNLKFNNEFVSYTTKKIIEDILSLGDCNLPKIHEHEYIHNEIFSMFNQHIYKITGKKHSKCPIT
jgi:hypothetical protein